MVVSAHQATYGIVQQSLLRPRMLSAGILFLLFCGIPLLLASRSFGYLGLKPSFEGLAVAGDVKTEWYVGVLRCFDLAFSAGIFGSFSSVFFESVLPSWRDWTFLGVMLFLVAAYRLLSSRFQNQPGRATALAFLCILVFVFSVIAFTDRLLTLRALWFLGVGLWFAWMLSSTRPEQPGRQVFLDLAFFQAFAVIALFATLVFPEIRSSLGGGMPSPIIIQFKQDSPFSQQLEKSAWLIDESDRGIYVVLAKTDRTAIFVPRESISAIYFGKKR
jgi:hypothetical protein